MMDSKEEIIKKILALKDCEKFYFNMFMEGGAMVVYLEFMYFLFEIPVYGGAAGFHQVYKLKDVEKLVDEALSWT